MEYSEGKIFGNEKIKLVQVPGDGSCMFYAVVQQITGWTRFDEKFKEKARQLRKWTVEYLWNNREDMKEVILAAMDDGTTIIPEENSEEYMALVVEYIMELAKDSTWAGTESIMALKEILQKNIRVFSPDMAPQEYQFGDGLNQTIEIYYNGVNHYNSIHRVEEGEEDCERKKGKDEQSKDAVRSVNREKD